MDLNEHQGSGKGRAQGCTNREEHLQQREQLEVKAKRGAQSLQGPQPREELEFHSEMGVTGDRSLGSKEV